METELIRHYQNRYKRWIKSEKWDYIAEKLTDIEYSTIKQIMNAEKDEDCNWLVWKNADSTMNRIKQISKQIKLV